MGQSPGPFPGEGAGATGGQADGLDTGAPGGPPGMATGLPLARVSSFHSPEARTPELGGVLEQCTGQPLFLRPAWGQLPRFPGDTLRRACARSMHWPPRAGKPSFPSALRACRGPGSLPSWTLQGSSLQGPGTGDPWRRCRASGPLLEGGQDVQAEARAPSGCPGRGGGGICFLLAMVPSVLPPEEVKMVPAS